MNERPTLSAPNPAYHLTVEAPGRIGRGLPRAGSRLAANEVRIATLYSGISAGTEMTAFLGSNPFLNRRWDPQARLFVEGDASWTYPMPAMGYEEVGRIVEVGPEVTKVQPGQVVWGTWRHRSEHVADEDWAAVRILPESVDPRLGIFSQIGAIALNAVARRQHPPWRVRRGLRPGRAGADGHPARAAERCNRHRRGPARVAPRPRAGPWGGACRGRHRGRRGRAHQGHHRRARRRRLDRDLRRLAARCTRRSAPPPTTAGSSPAASSRAMDKGSASARSSTTTGSTSSARRSAASTRRSTTAGTGRGSTGP